jgi:hypothetical protein
MPTSPSCQSAVTAQDLIGAFAVQKNQADWRLYQRTVKTDQESIESVESGIHADSYVELGMKLTVIQQCNGHGILN